MDLTDTIIPKSDQLNAEDLLTGPRTVTITEVRRGSDEQPVNVHLAEFPGRPFRPSKTVLRVLVAAWGKDSDAYVGRRLTLYRDPEVRFAGLDVGGIRVSAMSHIDKPLKLALTVSKGKKAPYVVKPLAADTPPAPVEPAKDTAARIDKALTAFAGIDVSEQQLTDRIGRKPDEWTPQDLASLEVVFMSIRRGETTVAEQFPQERVTTAEIRRGAQKPADAPETPNLESESGSDWPATATIPGTER